MKRIVIFSLLLFVSIMVSTIAAQEQAPQQPAQAPAPGQMGGGMPGARPGNDMMAHQQIVGEMKATMERLDKAVKAMNEAKGDAKVDAMATVVNEMASQQNQSTRDMMQMRMRMLGSMQGQGGDMMAQHQKMIDDMKASTDRLDKKVQAMNKATGATKVDAVAEVINELATQHKQNLPDMMRMRMMMMRRAPMVQRMPGGMMMPGMQNRQTTDTTTHP